MSVSADDSSDQTNKNWLQRSYPWQTLAFILICYAAFLTLILLIVTNQISIPGSRSLDAAQTPASSQTLKNSSASGNIKIPDQKDISILVLNGTGLPGQAGKVKQLLSNLGYQDIAVGNTDQDGNFKTTIFYKSRLNKAISDEITTTLQKVFLNIITKESSASGKYQIQIITGQEK